VIDWLFAGYLRLSTAIVRAVAMFAIVVMTGVGALEIGARAFFSTSLPWTQEVSILAAMWVYFFAYALIAKQHEYLRVEFLVGLLPSAARKIISASVRVVVILFYGTLGWFSIRAISFLALFHTDVLEVPEYLLVIPLMLGAIDIALTEAIYFIWQLRGRSVPGSDGVAPAHA
jgi:TRAP-type C4-dicarboxylate transport system permease small subunit